MHQQILAATLTLMLASVACAADKPAREASPAQKAQQMRMKECNADATGKKGDERKAFMSSCLTEKKASQQDKMTTCNKEAGDKQMKGDERKAFMSDCLKG